MTSSTSAQLSDHAVACLECACTSSDNQAARMLLLYADAQTATGVLAAVFIALAEGGTHMIELARAAIAHERARCTLDGRYGGRGCYDAMLEDAS